MKQILIIGYYGYGIIGHKMNKSAISSASSNNIRGYVYSGLQDGELVIVLMKYDLNYAADVNIIIDGETGKYSFDEYYLKPEDKNTLQSRMIYVNDELMEYNNGKFPVLQSVKGNGMNVTIDPARIVFVVAK